jgi:hypothetical protein
MATKEAHVPNTRTCEHGTCEHDLSCKTGLADVRKLRLLDGSSPDYPGGPKDPQGSFQEGGRDQVGLDDTELWFKSWRKPLGAGKA